MKIRNVFGNRYSGTLGKDVVAVQGRTTDYLRAYAKPSNPNSERQRAQRAVHTQALRAWQGLSGAQKAFYGRLEPPRRGYDLFRSRAMLALGRGEPIEVPVRMSWTPEGDGIDRAHLIVRRPGALLFARRLAAPVEVALTTSDVPYTFVLARGAREDGVLTLDRSWSGDPPGDLASAELGIQLIARGGDTPIPPAPRGPTRTIREVLRNGQEPTSRLSRMRP